MVPKSVLKYLIILADYTLFYSVFFLLCFLLVGLFFSNINEILNEKIFYYFIIGSSFFVSLLLSR
jgi:hypothetical protein